MIALHENDITGIMLNGPWTKAVNKPVMIRTEDTEVPWVMIRCPRDSFNVVYF